MKKILLTALILIVAATAFTLQAQDNEIIDNGNWEYQPVKVETFLYNSGLFEFDSQSSGNGTDSIPESVTEFVYGNNMITAVTSSWIDAEWKMELKTAIYLKNELQIDSMVMSVYDTINAIWIRSFKMVNEFEGDLQLHTKTYAADSLSGEWELFAQTDMVYNNSGYKTTETMSTFLPDSGRLIVTTKTDYFADSQGRVDSTKNFFKMPVMGWTLNSQTNYYYTSSGNLDYQETMISDFISPSLSPSSKTVFSYTAEGNQNIQAYYSWNPVAMDYILESKDSTVFSNNNRPLVQINMEKPLLVNELLVYQKTYFTYDTPSFVLEPLKEKNITVYPNPAADVLHIKTKTAAENHIQLFDMNGKLVMNKTIQGNTAQLPVRQLVKGSYFLQVKSEVGTHSQIVLIR